MTTLYLQRQTLRKNIEGSKDAIISLNIGGDRDLLFWLLEQKAKIICVQETRMDAQALATFQISAKIKGWNLAHRSAEIKGKGRSAGYIVLAKEPIPIQTRQSNPRFLHVAIPWIRKMAIHIISIYGYDSSYQDCLQLNADLVFEIQEISAQLGNVPLIVVGDHNLNPNQAQQIWGHKFSIQAPEEGTFKDSNCTLDYMVCPPKSSSSC